MHYILCNKNKTEDFFSFLYNDLSTIKNGISTKHVGFDRSYDYETDNDGINITIEVPGYNDNTINITAENDLLLIEGIEDSLKGKFTQKFTVNDKYDITGAHASIVDGILTLSVPYKEIAKPRKIDIKVGK